LDSHNVLSAGLVIVPREEAGLGEIPNFARFDALSSSLTKRQAGYAVGSDSMTGLVDMVNAVKPVQARVLGPGTLNYLNSFLPLLVH